MAKDPAVLFYTSDFLTGTITMSNEQVGKYIRLLCLQHQKYELKDSDMLFMCGEYDKDIYEKFTKTDTGYYNERMRVEFDRRKRYSESRSKNRSKNIKDMKNICKSYDKHMENENENTTISLNSINRVYKLYPTKDINNGNRSTHKTSKDKIKIARMIKERYPIYKAMRFYLSECLKNKVYLKNLSVFLNNLPDVDLFDNLKYSDFETSKDHKNFWEE